MSQAVVRKTIGFPKNLHDAIEERANGKSINAFVIESLSKKFCLKVASTRKPQPATK